MFKSKIQKEIEPYRNELASLSLKVTGIIKHIKAKNIEYDKILKEIWLVNYKIDQLAKSLQLEWDKTHFISKRHNKS
jgi:3-isopropylmalate dehydratase small subunit